jgi:ABC-type branched-subunit amino acid transport system substrate-binding protein
MLRSRDTSWAAAAVAMLALTACGSTVQNASGGQAAGGLSSTDGAGTSDGLSVPGVTGELGGADDATASGLDPLTDVAAGGSVSEGQVQGGPVGSGREAGAGAPAADPAAPAGGGQAGPGRASGATSTTVTIGFYYAEDGKESIRAFGASNDTPDFKDAANAMIKEINSTGGIAGRKIVPVFHGIRLAGERSAEDQAACSTFTQDNKVLAVVGAGTTSEQFAACLAKAGVAYVYAGLTVDNAAAFRRYPLLSEPISMNLDRLARVQADRLAAQGWLKHAPGSDAAIASKPVKLGVIVRDEPAFKNAYENVLKPAYARHGAPVSQVFYVSKNAQDLGKDIDAAVLRFAAENITHVTFLSSGGLTPGLFMIRATGQRYQPRYGFNSQDAPQVVLPNLPDKKGQLRGALGVGWLPFGDVVNPTDPSVAAPSYQRCLTTLRKRGVNPTDANSAGLLSFVCDGWWFLQAALQAAPGGDLSPRGFVAGQDRLGASYRPAGVLATRVGPDQHDGVAAVRYLAFVDSCECFRYTSKNIPA